MLIAYMDESHSKSFFCFAAVIADATAIRFLSREMDALIALAAEECGVNSSAELHGYPICHGKGDWAGVGGRARAWIYERAVAAVLDSNATILLRGTRSSHLLERQRSRGYPKYHTREQVCFQHILERIDQVAGRQDSYALVVADERDDRESHRAHFEEYRRVGTPGEYMNTNLDRLLDTVYFAPSFPSRMLQAADMLAFLYHRSNTQTDPDPREREVMRRVMGKIVASPSLYKHGNWP